MAAGSLSREQLEEDLFGSWSDEDGDDSDDGDRQLKARESSV